jgi:pimeloyl-ACP methyl ester carboxylesterase
VIVMLACLVCAAFVLSAAPRTITGTVPNGNVKLAATLDLPDGPGPHPLVVALHASGAGERDFPSYRHLAQVLPARGIGVVRYDRRGSGASTGDFERASFPDLASDARSVVRWARGPRSVDRRRVALWGMSQGGWIAPLVAAQDPSIAGVVIVSGAGVTPAEQMIYSAETALREAGHPREVIERAARLRRAVDGYYAGMRSREEVAALLASARSEPWYDLTYLRPELPRDVKSSKWYYQFAFDPATSIAKVKAPVLLLFGERDPWIPVNESTSVWRARARADLTIRRIPGTNHFMAATTDATTIPIPSRCPRNTRA